MVTASKVGTVTTISVDGTAIATINDGAQGIQGETGPQGPKGDKGDTGECVVISVSSSTPTITAE